jgi:hypothetical protein
MRVDAADSIMRGRAAFGNELSGNRSGDRAVEVTSIRHIAADEHSSQLNVSAGAFKHSLQ